MSLNANRYHGLGYKLSRDDGEVGQKAPHSRELGLNNALAYFGVPAQIITDLIDIYGKEIARSTARIAEQNERLHGTVPDIPNLAELVSRIGEPLARRWVVDKKGDPYEILVSQPLTKH